MLSKRPSSLVLLIIIIAIIGGVFYLDKTYKTCKQFPDRVSERRLLNETTNWKAYINKKHHYSLQYPQDWVVKWLAGDDGSTVEDADLIELISNTEQGYTIEVVSLRSGIFHSLTIEQFSKQLDEFGWRGNTVISKEKSKLGGVQALRYTTKEVVGVRVIKPTTENKVCLYDVSLQGENPNPQTISIFNTVLSTFKFL